MTVKRAYIRLFTTVFLIIVTMILYILKVSKLRLGVSFFGFILCAVIALIFSYKTIKDVEAKIDDKNIKKTEKYDWITFVALSVMFIFVLFMFFILPSSVSQTSMTPTLNDKERILIYHFQYKPHKNDIVIIKMSEDDYPRAGGILNSNTYFVKRIVALPGDEITFKLLDKNTFYVYINNEIYKNSYGESYEITDYQKAALELDLIDSKVPNKMYLVFGDNEMGSQDSRTFGPIKEKDIVGKVIYKIWPLGRID